MGLLGLPRVNRTVLGLGLVSLLTDVSSESIFPLLPAFLASLGAGATFVGALEGFANLVANVLKYYAGSVADRLPRQKPLVLAGYTLSSVARPLVAFASMPAHVLLVRSADRIGKGLRSAPRDAMIADATPPPERGAAYGFHRGMDHAGAALGTVLCSALLALGLELREVFLWAAVPGALAVVAAVLTPEAAREPFAPPRTAARAPIRKELRRALLPLSLVAFSASADAFLLLKAGLLGAPAAALPLLWLLLHVVKATSALYGGRLADRFGPGRVLTAGWLGFGACWASAGAAPSLVWLFTALVPYGAALAMVEASEKTLVAELAGEGKRGRSFGAYNMVTGVAGLLVSALLGLAWDRLGPSFAFLAGAALAASAAGLLFVGVVRQNRTP